MSYTVEYDDSTALVCSKIIGDITVDLMTQASRKTRISSVQDFHST